MPAQMSKHKTILFALMMLLVMSTSVAAQKSTKQIRASSFRLEKYNDRLDKKLYITVNGRERKITNQAVEAWIVNDGKSVVYSGLDGSGGFENEGQSLRTYDVRTGRLRKILSEYTIVVALMEVKLSTGQRALLVKLADGGLGASYFAVVDPSRGEVFFRSSAELTRLDGDNITLAFYVDDDWDKINGARFAGDENPNQVISQTEVKPTKTETHDLKRLLKRKVVYNKRSPI